MRRCPLMMPVGLAVWLLPAPALRAQGLQADLAVILTDSWFGPTRLPVTAAPEPLPPTPWGISYTIKVFNYGPSAVSGAVVTNVFAPALYWIAWTCTATAGSSCPASGTDSLSVPVNLAAGGRVTFTANAAMDFGTPGSLVDTATVTGPGGTLDPNPANNTVVLRTFLDGTPNGTDFRAMTPCRVADTRGPVGPSGGPALEANQARTFQVSGGPCGIPLNARAVAFNVTVLRATDVGDLRLYPPTEAAPDASTVNFVVDRARANNAIIKVAPYGAGERGVAVRCDMPESAGTVHLVLDVYGWYQ